MYGKKLTEKDYVDFLDHFTQRLGEEHSDICFYIYGSFAEERYDAGRSDIDGGLILNSDVRMPKGAVLNLAAILADNARQYPVPIQFNIFDRTISRDGRFLSYTADFTAYIQKNGRIESGPDYVSEMNGLDFKSGVLTSIAFNLRRVRNGLLFAIKNLEGQREKFEEGALYAIETLSKLPKKLLWLQGHDIIADRFEAQEEIRRMFRKIDFSTLEEVNNLLKDQLRIEHFLSDQDNALKLYQESLDAVEKLIETYINEFPEFSRRELGCQLHHNPP